MTSVLVIFFFFNIYLLRKGKFTVQKFVSSFSMGNILNNQTISKIFKFFILCPAPCRYFTYIISYNLKTTLGSACCYLHFIWGTVHLNDNCLRSYNLLVAGLEFSNSKSCSWPLNWPWVRFLSLSTMPFPYYLNQCA